MIREAPAFSAPGNVVFHALYGSHAHGTATASSDEDWRGVFLLPNEAFLGLDRVPQTYEAPPDQVFWELGHFCRLLLKGNPNIVGMLFAPSDCIAFAHPAVLPLFDNRRRFIHEKTITAYMGWVSREMKDLQKGFDPATERFHGGSSKRLSHVPRLLWEIEGAVLRGWIEVRPTGVRHDVIMDIKMGRMSYEDAIAYCGDLLLDVERSIENVALPQPPRDWTLQYLLDTRKHYG